MLLLYKLFIQLKWDDFLTEQRKSLGFIVLQSMVDDMPYLAERLAARGISLKTHTLISYARDHSLAQARSGHPDLLVSAARLTQNVKAAANEIFSEWPFGKLEQFHRFVAASIPTLQTDAFSFGMSLPGDPVSLLTMKPDYLDTRLPESMITLQRRSLSQIAPQHFRPDHPILSHRYIVQEFIDTGPRAMSYRVVLFCGEPILSYLIVSRVDKPILKANQVHIGPEFISNGGVHGYRMELAIDPTMLDIAKAVSATMAHPVFAQVDLLFNKRHGWRALEISTGTGNSWPLGRPDVLRDIGREAAIQQFGLFDVMTNKFAELLQKVAS